MTVFEKADDVDLLAVIAITEDFKRRDVDGIYVTDKDAIRQMFRKDQNVMTLVDLEKVDNGFLAAYVEKRDQKEPGFKAAYEAEAMRIEEELN